MRRHRLGVGAAGVLIIAGCGGPEDTAQTEAAVAPAPQQTEAAAPKPSAPPTRRGLDEFDVETVKIVYRHFGNEVGMSTMWIEDYGGRVAMEVDIVTKMGNYEEPRKQRNYWDGERTYMHDLAADSTFSSPLRVKDMEPSAFAVTKDADLEMVGYQRLGDLEIAGQTCEHWRNEAINFEACRWKRLDLLSINLALADATGGFSLKKEAVELVEGEGIPAEFKGLAK